ncbi:DUF1580 domain-containing protein [Novipirellula artificiosorum]|uniref:DUF1580 domain-containing protein n=1 Tax=Novipirellula artificiosorum TaxID=2528016 RepID=A0A5C6DKZ5_9BACT|nr:DUF1580 domain-containing protein [Novipirellula artificiosorum]TWU37272.1 hypothetical protein Poly41_34010 [Novipirellula artificiosorum]
MPAAKEITATTQRLMSEDIVTLAQATLLFPEGSRPDRKSLNRWVIRGVDGTKLEAIRLGRILYTSVQAVTRFIDARSADLR